MKPKYWIVTILLLVAATVVAVYYILNQPQDLGPVTVKHQVKQTAVTAPESSNPANKFAGNWYWKDPRFTELQNGDGTSEYQSADMSVTLQVAGDKITGSYNATMYGGNRVAVCTPDDYPDYDTPPGRNCITGTINGDSAQITFLNGYQVSPPGQAALTYNPKDDTLTWTTGKLPPADFYVPGQAVLRREFSYQFIPEGWNVIAKTAGDFNGDGIQDMAFVAENVGQSLGKFGDENIYPRRLLVLFGLKNGGYKLSASSDKAILLNGDGGGGIGDPFGGGEGSLDFKNGMLEISFLGGDVDRWKDVYSFIYQNNQWQMADYTQDSFTTLDPNSKMNCTEDQNFLKGLDITTCGPDSAVKSKQKFTPPKPIPLQDFDVKAFGY